MITQAVDDKGDENTAPNEEQIRLASETFKLLADSTRLKILWALLHDEHSVSELAAHVNANTPAVSQQLSKLRSAHLVRVRREGNHVYYAMENEHVLALVEQALSQSDHMRRVPHAHEEGTRP